MRTHWLEGHPVLEELFSNLPDFDALFPDLTVNQITKAFAKARRRLKLQRPGLVFHSTRKWFITQCERTGVPEHFTASPVGHKSARSEDGITYGIYSAGISDEQKRSIIDQIRLPGWAFPTLRNSKKGPLSLNTMAVFLAGLLKIWRLDLRASLAPKTTGDGWQNTC